MWLSACRYAWVYGEDGRNFSPGQNHISKSGGYTWKVTVTHRDRVNLHVCVFHTCQGYPGYFREPHWIPMGILEISRVTGMVSNKTAQLFRRQCHVKATQWPISLLWSACSRCKPIELPWIFPGAPLKINGSRKYPGQLDRYAGGWHVITLSWCQSVFTGESGRNG